MGNGYLSPALGDYGWLIDELRRLAERLAELETPTGTSANSLVNQVQRAIADIDTTVTASIAANSYTKAQIDSKVASPGAISPTTVSASGGISSGGAISSGGTLTSTGDIYTPNASAAVSGYTICYLNSDGRVAKGASSARYKVNIEPVDPLSLGGIFPQLSTFAMRGDPDLTPRFGHIAEQLAANEHLRRFVVFAEEPVVEDEEVIGSRPILDEQGDPVPESIDFIGLLLAQTAQLNERLKVAGL